MIRKLFDARKIDSAEVNLIIIKKSGQPRFVTILENRAIVKSAVIARIYCWNVLLYCKPYTSVHHEHLQMIMRMW